MKRLLILAWMGVGLLAAFGAELPATARAPSGNRYLLAVDTSAAMRYLDLPSRQAVFDLIYTGLYGQLKTGDTYGLWTFNEQPNTGIYPMQVWAADHTMELASSAAKFLRAEHYGKRCQMGALMTKVLSVVKNVRDVTVFIISDGESEVTGTPFDFEIKVAYAANAAARRQAKQPCVTTLVARDGTIVSAAVTTAGEPILLLAPADKSKITDAAVKLPTTGPATNAVAFAANPPPPSNGSPSTSTPASTVVDNIALPPPVTNAPAPATKKVIPITTLANPTPRLSEQATQDTTHASPPVPISVEPMNVGVATPPLPPPTIRRDEKPVPPAAATQLAQTERVVIAKPATTHAAPVTDTDVTRPAVMPARAMEKTKSDPTAQTLAQLESPASLEKVFPIPTPVAARENAGSGKAEAEKSVGAPVVATATVPRDSGLSARTMFIVGGGIAALALVLVGISLWRLWRPVRPSSITRSMR